MQSGLAVSLRLIAFTPIEVTENACILFVSMWLFSRSFRLMKWFCRCQLNYILNLQLIGGQIRCGRQLRPARLPEGPAPRPDPHYSSTAAPTIPPVGPQDDRLSREIFHRGSPIKSAHHRSGHTRYTPPTESWATVLRHLRQTEPWADGALDLSRIRCNRQL